jgi:adenylylsulfate kinase-like enzyme
MRNNYGDLFWITGLAGAGKSTIAQKLYCMLKEKNCNVVFLDGDNMREVLGVNAQYDLKARLELALVYSRLCRMLTDQGLDVICATVSCFLSVGSGTGKIFQAIKKYIFEFQWKY